MISPAAKAIRETLVREPLDDTPLNHKREQWEASSRLVPTPTGANVQKVKVGGVACLLCEPDHLNTNTVIVYFHGGGLVEGSAETFRVWTSRMALHLGCRVVSVDYRLAPEYPYPAALNDVLAVCNALPAYFDCESWCIGADSTGCILALSAILKLSGSNRIFPSRAFLLSPSIDLSFSSASIKTNAGSDRVVSLDVARHCAKLYAGEHDLRNPDISPLFADFQRIPPMLVLVDDSEILLDDAKRLKQKLIESGGVVDLRVSHGLWHVWPAWGEFPESINALDDIKQHIFT